MSTYTEKILQLIQQEPGLLQVDISERLDIDARDVKDILKILVNAEHVYTRKKLVGTLEFDTYHPTILSAIKISVANKAVHAATVDGEAAGVSKAQKGLDYLAGKNGVTTDELRQAMGLASPNTPAQYLATYMKNGTVLKNGGKYCLASEAVTPAPPEQPKLRHIRPPIPVPARPVASKPPVSGHDPVHLPQHYTAGGIDVIEILRAKLSPEEFRGFLKGNVIKYTLRAELKNGMQDYQKGHVYAKWLAEASSAI